MNLSSVSIEPIIRVLKELIQLHQQLLDTSERKKQTLVEGNVDALTQLLKEEAKLVKELGKCEEERVFQLKQYLQVRGMKEENFSLRQLIEIVIEPKQQKVLVEQLNQLQEVVGSIQEINQLNTKLLEDSLAYVNQSIELITDVRDDEINYKRPNQGKSSSSVSGRGFFDQKA